MGRILREDSLGYMFFDKDILIFFGYKGKLKVECMRKIFNIIEEFIVYFLYYVIMGCFLIGKWGVYLSD